MESRLRRRTLPEKPHIFLCNGTWLVFSAERRAGWGYIVERTRSQMARDWCHDHNVRAIHESLGGVR